MEKKKQINEAFASKKLAALSKQHGGIDVGRNGGIRDGAKAFFGGSSVDVSKITDDMLSGEPFKYDYLTTPDRVSANLIHFNDGYAVSLKPYDLRNSDNINPAEPRRKPSRYGTGIGDTGDHDKRESPFFKNGKKDVGPEYNGFSVSARAGESKHYRDAFNNNKKDFEYFKEHPERYDAGEGMRNAARNMDKIRGYGRNLLSKSKNESVMKFSESDLRKIVSESVKNILKEGDEMSNMYYPEKLMYYTEDGNFGGDMGYDFLDKDELGSNDPSTIVNGMIDYLTNDYPSEKEEIYYDCVLVLYLGHGDTPPEKLYISSIDGKYANEISVASEKSFGVRVPVEVVGRNTNESKISGMKQTVKINESALRKIVAESVKRVLKEWSDDMEMTRDRVTPGDSLPIISTTPRKGNRFEYLSNREKLEDAIKNQITNKEGLGERYSLRELSNDIARRFRLTPTVVLQHAKKVYNYIGAHRAMDM